MKKGIAVLLVLLGWASVAIAAPRGKAFLHGMHVPSDLATVIIGALEKDPGGHKIISPAKCRADGSCAAPVDYLEAIQKADPDSNLARVADLPAYLRSLETRDSLEGEYWMACLRYDRNSPTGYSPLLHCVARAFKPGEQAWVNPKTGRVVLAQDCTNPVEKPETPAIPAPVPPPLPSLLPTTPAKVMEKPTGNPCVEIHFFTRPGDTGVRFKQYGPTDISSDVCTALKRAGETEWESPFVERCPNEDCDFQVIDEVLGEKGWETGSFTPTPGENVLRLPAKVAERDSGYRTVFCLDRGGEHSDGIVVQWFDYLGKGLGSHPKIATIYYTSKEVPDGSSSNLYWPWGEWYGQ